jgi:diguanylate cyclase (GGDEF)-like protein/PAS domain S-box-containing protein
LPIHIPYYLFAVLINFAAFSVFGLLSYRQRDWRSFPFLVLMLVVTLWTVGCLSEMLAYSPKATLFWAKFQYLGISSIGVAWLLFILTYYQENVIALYRCLWFLWIFPAVTLILVFTNQFHHLIWSKVIDLPGSAAMLYGRGFWFWLNIVFNYACICISALLIYRKDKVLTRFKRTQIFWLVAALLPPFIGNILYLLRLVPIKSLDFTPFGFSISILLTGFSIFPSRILPLIPVFYQRLLDVANAPVFLLDISSRIIDANQPACNLVGLDKEGIINQPVSELLQIGPLIGEQLNIDTVSTFEMMIDQPEKRNYEVKVIPLFSLDKHLQGRFVIFTDITKYRSIEEDLRIVTQAIEQSEQTIVITDRDGAIEYVNPFFTVMTGYTREEALGQNPRILKSGMMPPEIYQELWKTILSGETWRGELLNRNKKGDLYWEEAVISPVRDGQGAITHFVATKNNITKRKQTEDALEKSDSDLRLIYDISLELAAINDRDNLIQTIVRRAPSILKASMGGLYLVEEDGMTLTLVAGHNLPDGILGKNLRSGEGLSGKVLKTGLPAMVPDYSAWEFRSPLFASYPFRRTLAVPLKTSARIIGVINITDFVSTEPFTEDEVRLAMLFADQAAGALEKAHLLDVSRRRTNQMAAVSRIGQAVTSNLQIDQVIRKLYEQCLQILPLDVFYVATYDADSGLIEHPLFIDQGLVKDVSPRNITDIPGLSGEVIRQRYTLYIPDTADPQVKNEHQIIHVGGEVARSYLGVPLTTHGQIIGVISIQSYSPNAYLYEQIQLLETIAIQAAIALENAQLFERMRSMAITDVLTQINTRRHFFELAQIEIIRAIRYGHLLSVIMIDIDRFKNINDTCGHDIGDQALYCVAQLLKRTLRQVDIIGRYGGEEFAALLPETGLKDACLAAERLRRAVEAMVIPGANDKVHVTISMGVAELNMEVRTLEELLKRADQALYRAKETGRNRYSI